MDERFVSHYRLVAALGSGSMGRVYKAWDTRLNRWVAIKFLAPQLANDSEASARFRREARAASSLEHGHICSIFDIDRDDTGATFLVMAWYEGETLARKLNSGPLRADQALGYARQIALGLAAAHRQGIVHRDIKPANVIITLDDEAVILDFGVAYLMEETRLSSTGSRSGTLAYMAPEQFTGGDPQPAMDVWSLGVLLYEMMTGRLPFKGDITPALTYAIAHEDPLPLPDDLAAAFPGSAPVLDRCLAKQPDDRYDSAADLASDLSLIINDSHAGLAAPRPLFRIKGRLRRRVALGISALVLLGVGILAGTKGLFQGSDPDLPGMAVLPFTVNKEGELQREFGEGLAWLLANRLGHLAGSTDEFWVVPPEDLLLYGIGTPLEAREQAGIDRTISGVGTIAGSVLTLYLEYRDLGGGPPATLEFRDDLANLPTWQQGLMDWSLDQLDPGHESEEVRKMAPGCTQVPEALYAYLDGIAWSRRYHHQDPDLQRSLQDKALNAFGAAVARDSSFARARSELGHALFQRYGLSDTTRLHECESHLRRATMLDPTDAEPRFYLGNLLLAQGDTQSALATYDEALRREPDFKPALMAKIDFSLSVQDEPAAERAIRALQKARPGYAVDCLTLGVRYWQAGNVPRSVSWFRQAVDLTPNNARALYYLGATLFELDNDPEAESLFRKAIALAPDHQVYQNLGTYYYYNNRYSDALVQYRKSLEMKPDGRYDIWGNLAECYRWSPGYEDSLVIAFKRAQAMAENQLRTAPGDPWLMADLATYCSVLGDTSRTLDLLAQLSEEKHLGALAEFMVSVAWEDIGRRAEALVWLDQAFSHGLRPTRVEGYPGFRNLRTDPRYALILDQYQ